MRRRATPLSHLYPGTPWCRASRAKSKMEQTPLAKYGNWQHLQYPGAALDMLSLLQLVLHTFSRNLNCWAKGVYFPCFAGMYAGWCNFILILWLWQRLQLDFVTRIGQCDQIGAESLCLGVNGSRLQRLSPFLGWTDFTVTELNHFSSDPSLFFVITVTGEVTTQKPICWWCCFYW